MSSRRGLRIIGPMQVLVSSSGSIFGFTSAMFQTSNTSSSMYFSCNSRTYVITLYLCHVCAVLCSNASVLRTHMDPD
jgi:hypothetical protein